MTYLCKLITTCQKIYQKSDVHLERHFTERSIVVNEKQLCNKRNNEKKLLNAASHGSVIM